MRSAAYPRKPIDFMQVDYAGFSLQGPSMV